MVDRQQRIVAWNRQASRAFGCDDSTAIGSVCHDLIGATDRAGKPFCQSSCPVVASAREGRAVPPLKLKLRNPDGSDTLIEISTILLGGEEGGIVHLVREQGKVDPPPESQPSISSLTRREKEILGCLCGGQSTTAMAHSLEISRTTVRNHVQHVLEKLAVHSRAEAIAAAHRNGVLTRT